MVARILLLSLGLFSFSSLLSAEEWKISFLASPFEISSGTLTIDSKVDCEYRSSSQLEVDTCFTPELS